MSQFIVANEGNNAASDDGYKVKNFNGTLTCRAPPYTESDASGSEADGNKSLLIIFWKIIIMLLKPIFMREIFMFRISKRMKFKRMSFKRLK